MRLEGVVAGQVIFILAAPDERATLYLPRAGQVVRDEAPGAILDALTGVDFGAADLQAVLTGCVVPGGTPRNGQLFPNGWAAIEMDGGATLYLQRIAAGWRLRAARRSGWRIDYQFTTGTFPASVGLVSDTGEVDLVAAIAAIETNIELDPAALGRVNVPPGVAAITLEELRRSGPLRGP